MCCLNEWALGICSGTPPDAPAILAAGGFLCSYSLSFDSPFVSGPAAI